MGACGSSANGGDAQQVANSKAIDRKNRADNNAEQAKVKLLLLGAGESGKSTIFKQMRILYGAHKGYTKEERERFRATVAGNILTNMKTVLENCEKFTPLADETLKEKVAEFMSLEDGKTATITPDTAELVSAFWNDEGFQQTWHHRSNFQVQDALEYYSMNIARIGTAGYVPDDQDILRSRVRTSGIVEEVYKIDGVTFVMFDVGGQRNERKKWIHCFEDVTAVIFVAAINEYDQVLFEDSTMNRLDEAVILFDEIANSIYFKSTDIILFLNKDDLFRDKLCEVPFRVDEGPEQRHVDFNGPVLTDKIAEGDDAFTPMYEATKKYIVQLFINRNKNPQKSIYYHITCATDTKNVSVVFNASKNIILHKNLSSSGFSLS